MAHGDPVLHSLYVYAPNKVAPAVFTVLYALSAFFHIWQCIRYNAWKLVGLHAFCGVLFTAGYALREYGSFNYIYDGEDKTVLFTFIMSQVFIYVCPPFLELSNYHILGRLFYYIPHCAPLPPGNVLATFGGLMLLVELLNSLGVALASNPTSSTSSQETGSRLTIVAVVIQIAIILVFLCIASVFQLRCAKNSSLYKNIKIMLIALYVSMTFILIRCVYRLVEHTGHTGVDADDLDALRGLSPLLRYEAFFYVFEATLMFLNSALWNIWHPGRFLRRDSDVYLGMDGVENRRPAEPDIRPPWQKVLRILSFGVVFRKKKGFENQNATKESARSPETAGIALHDRDESA